MKNFENVASAATWAAEYIKEYNKSGDFNPFALLTGTQDKKQQIFCECCDFLQTLEEATEKFRRTRDKITFS